MAGISNGRESGFLVQEKREEGGKCLPGDYCFLHYEHPPGEC